MKCDVNCKYYAMCWNIGEGTCEIGEECDKYKPEPPEEYGKWIPISEAQPEANGWYLTSTMYGSVYTDHWCIDHFDRTETVLAWMEFPEPYKKEGGDRE